VPAITLVAIGTLHENGGLGKTFGKNLAANVVEPNSLSDVTPRLLHHLAAVDVGEEAQAEAVGVAGVGEAIHCDAGLRGVKGLADARVQLVIGDGTPKGGLEVDDRLRIARMMLRGGRGTGPVLDHGVVAAT